jgi:hypothetical protein
VSKQGPNDDLKSDPIFVIFKLTIYLIISFLIAYSYSESLKLECQKKMIDANRRAEDIISVCGEF